MLFRHLSGKAPTMWHSRGEVHGFFVNASGGCPMMWHSRGEVSHASQVCERRPDVRRCVRLVEIQIKLCGSAAEAPLESVWSDSYG